MDQQQLFAARLAGLLDYAAAHEGILTPEEINDYFEGIRLTQEQSVLIYDYLEGKNVRVAGHRSSSPVLLMPDSPVFEDIPENGETSDEVLQMYLEEVKLIPPAADGEEEVLIRAVKAGDTQAVKRLTELYLYTVIAIARDYAKGSIPAGDLIQEGNMGLLTGISMLADKPADTSDEDYLVGSIREAIELYVIDQGGYSDLEKKALKKANELKDSVSRLEEELGHRITKEEFSAFSDIPVAELEEVIRLTGDRLFE